MDNSTNFVSKLTTMFLNPRVLITYEAFSIGFYLTEVLAGNQNTWGFDCIILMKIHSNQHFSFSVYHGIVEDIIVTTII